MSQLVLPLQTPSALGRNDFIVSPGNEQAIAFIDSWPQWPAPAAAIYGPAASGKSHLSAIWANMSGALTVEAGALQGMVPDGPLVIENVEPGIAEIPLFALLERGTALLLTAQTPPSLWPVQLPDLKSRLNALLSFALWAPDDALLMGLAVKLFADRQIQVPQSVIAHMIQRLERSPAVIRDFVARADAAALAAKRPINLNLIRDLLAQESPVQGS